MKSIYLFLCYIIFTSWSIAQTTNLTLIDRANVSSGSTLTGNAAGISSIGFTRGSGLGPGSGVNHTSNSWQNSDATSAAAAGEYIEWSMTALPTYTITLDEIDVRLRRDGNGPSRWQIFYSNDGFTSDSNELTPEQVTPGSAQNFSFNNTNTAGVLPIQSSQGGTLTFRLYAWDANSAAGILLIANGSVNGWQDLGISSPGMRLRGSTETGAINSLESDIINASYTEETLIDYISFNATSGLVPNTNSVQIGSFTIRDGGTTSPDADSDPTILSDISFTVANPEYLAAIAIYEQGGSLASEVTSITSLTEFTNLNSGSGIVAPDDGSITFDIYATFTANVEDREQFQLTINSVTTPSSGSSQFEFGDAGGAATPVNGDTNRIEVDGATFLYQQNTSDVNLFEPMNLPVQIIAVDANVNLDINYGDLGETVSLFATGSTFDAAATTSVVAENGIAVFQNLRFSTEATNVTITAFDPPDFINSQSANFNVIDPVLTLAVQDFDGSNPEWTYTTNESFFDFTWGVGGYYGTIDSGSASPLDELFFENNILGENDLDSNGILDEARITFGDIDVSGYNDVKIEFDWQVKGYNQNRNDVRYRVFLNGAGQDVVTIFNGTTSTNEGGGRVSIDIPDGTSTVSLWVDVRNWEAGGYSGFDNFRVIAELDALVYRNGVWNPSTPDLSTGAQSAIINDGTYTVSERIELNDIYIESEAAVEMNPGETMRIFGNIRNLGLLTLNSTSTQYSSIYPNSTSGDGSYRYNRFVNVLGTGSSGGNDLIALPLIPDSGLTFDQFITFGSPSNASKLADNDLVYAFGPFDPASITYQNFLISGNNTLSSGVGYRAATTLGETLTFDGAIVTSDVTGIEVSKPFGGTQWNLVGNPYPSYIEPIDFLTNNAANLDPNALAVYGYNSATASGSGTIGNFTVVNAATNSSTKIAPGQGFFVAAVNTEGFVGSINFSNDLRTLTGNNDFILSRNNSPSENLNLRMSISNGIQDRSTDIYFHENGSRSLDPGYDAATFGNELGSFELYSTLVENDEGRSMTIQTLGLEDINEVRIPIGVNANQGQQLSFRIESSNLNPEIEVILEDTAYDTFTNLNSGNYVITTLNNLTGTGRFYLNFRNNTLSTNRFSLDNLNVFSDSNKQIHVNGIIEENTRFELYDIQGRMVSNYFLNSNELEQSFDATNFNGGVYIIRLTNTAKTRTVKIILN